MLKIIGMISVMVSSTWYGFYFSKGLVNRPKQIRQLKAALQSLEAEVSFNHRPLREAATKIATQVKGPIAQLFVIFSTHLEEGMCTAKEAWSNAVEKMKVESALKADEIDVLHQFGETLGIHDAQSQQKQIALTLKQLERMEVEAIESQHQYERMFKTLGVLTGLLIVIILI